MAVKAGARKMVSVRTPNKKGSVGRLDAAKYEAMRATLLRVLPKGPPGMTQAEMFTAVSAAVPKGVFPGTTSAWWAKGVQLDLEARGVVKRDAKARPLRWWKAT